MKLKMPTMLLAVSAGFVTATALPAIGHSETFTMWVRSDGANFLPQLVEDFNQTHENQVDLEIVPSTQVVQKYATSIAAGNAPDAMSLDLIYTPAFAAAGELEDMTEWLQSRPYFDALSPAHVKTGTYEERIYGVPFSAESSVLFWNKTLYEKAGLDPEQPPKTWADIASAAEKIGALGDGTYGYYFSGACGGCNIFTFAPMIWASGGDILSEDGAEATLDTPQMREAIAFYRGMIGKGLVPAGARTDSGTDFLSFAGNNIGIQPMGAFALGILTTQHPEVDFGVTTIPGRDGGWSTFAGGDNFVVTSGTDKIEAIQEFLDYTYSLEGQTTLAKYGSLPVRSDIAGEALKSLDPRYGVLAEAMPKGRTPYSVVFNDVINSANSPWTQMFNEVMFGDDVDGSLRRAQEEMQSIIDAAE